MRFHSSEVGGPELYVYPNGEKMEYYNKCTTPLSGIFERASERETEKKINLLTKNNRYSYSYSIRISNIFGCCI